MVRAPSLVTDHVKESICPKVVVPGMEKPSYLPSCLQQCSEMCGVRCRGKCWGQHPGACNQQCKPRCTEVHPPICNRGKLDSRFLFCPSGGIGAGGLQLTLSYIKFETVDVQTYGKGAAFTRVDKVETEMIESDFINRFKHEFIVYSEHIVPSWFLR